VNVDLLRSTWAEALGYGDAFVAHFYARLFFEHPDLRGLFGTDMAGQRKKIAATLDLVVQGADSIEAVVPRLRQLGRMHRRFGVTVNMFPAVGEALLATFARFLGDHWTDEAAQTWADAFGLVSAVMVDAYTEADRFDGPPYWDVLVVDVQRDADVLRIAVDADSAYPWQPCAVAPVRLPDVAGTWRNLQLSPARHELLVPIDARPDGVTLDLLSMQPGDHLWLAAPLDPVDQEAKP
jgi:hemoglobin-like flavoprotein